MKNCKKFVDISVGEFRYVVLWCDQGVTLILALPECFLLTLLWHIFFLSQSYIDCCKWLVHIYLPNCALSIDLYTSINTDRSINKVNSYISFTNLTNLCCNFAIKLSCFYTLPQTIDFVFISCTLHNLIVCSVRLLIFVLFYLFCTMLFPQAVGYKYLWCFFWQFGYLQS